MAEERVGAGASGARRERRLVDAAAAAVVVLAGIAIAATAPTGLRTALAAGGALLAAVVLVARERLPILRRRSAAALGEVAVAAGIAVAAAAAGHAFLALPALAAAGVAGAVAAPRRPWAVGVAVAYGALLAVLVVPDADRPEELAAGVTAVGVVFAGAVAHDLATRIELGRRRAGFEEVLRSCTERLVAAHDLHDVYAAVLDGAVATAGDGHDDTHDDATAVVLRDDGRRVVAARGRGAPDVGRDVDVPASVAPALGSHRTVLLDDGPAHELLRAVGMGGPDGTGADSDTVEQHVLVSPMVQDDRVHGIVVAVTQAPIPEVAVQALDVLADTAAIAVAEQQCSQDLHLSDARYRSLVADSPDVIAVVDVEGEVRYLSPSVAGMLGAEPDGLVRRPLQDLLHPDDVGTVAAYLARAAETGREGAGVAARVRLRNQHDGSWRAVELRGRRLRSQCGDDCPYHGRETDVEVVLNLRDVTDRVALERQLAHQALHDALTELPNRALLLDRLRQALLPGRGSGQPAALLLIDLDDFKSVNDGFGHVRGDAVLREVADRLAASLRPGDTAARLGGDEFAVVVPGARGATATQVAERVLEHLREPCTVGTQRLHLSASVGIALGAPGTEPEELVRQADIAMYDAKRSGKGRWRRFSETEHASHVVRGQRSVELRDAVERGEIVVHYQPTIDLDAGEIVGFEALVRWQHPRDGLLPPADFIPIAEASGVIDRVGIRVLGDAIEQLARWNADGSEHFVSVNVSPVQLSSDALLDVVRDHLGDHRVRADLLTLEITETALIADLQSVLGRLHQLKRLGVRIAVDDFGTGYSSLRYLEELPVDVLKIDRAFVQRLASAPPSPLTQSVLDLGRSLRLTTIAEGVEREEQVGALRRLGCHLGQGYHLGRPMDAAAATALLHAPSARANGNGNGQAPAGRATGRRATAALVPPPPASAAS